jgi:hypothetical protein
MSKKKEIESGRKSAVDAVLHIHSSAHYIKDVYSSFLQISFHFILYKHSSWAVAAAASSLGSIV